MYICCQKTCIRVGCVGPLSISYYQCGTLTVYDANSETTKITTQDWHEDDWLKLWGSQNG
jgi:hypothetical protein